MNVSIADSTGTLVPLAVSVVDVSGWHSTTVNNSRITPDIDGLYRLHASVEWGSSAIDESVSRFYVNGSGTPKSICRFVGTNVVGSHVNMHFVELTAGDYVEIYVLQNSGSARPATIQLSCELVRAS